MQTTTQKTCELSHGNRYHARRDTRVAVLKCQANRNKKQRYEKRRRQTSQDIHTNGARRATSLKTRQAREFVRENQVIIPEQRLRNLADKAVDAYGKSDNRNTTRTTAPRKRGDTRNKQDYNMTARLVKLVENTVSQEWQFRGCGGQAPKVEE